MKRWGRWLVLGMVATGGVALAKGEDKKQQPPQQQQMGGQGGSGQQMGQGQDSQHMGHGDGQMGQGQHMGMGQGQHMGMGQGGSGKDMMMGNLPVPQDEQSLANHMHHMNMMEMELAQLAQQKATSPDVKKFAQMILSDHQAADQKLTQWAQRKGLTLAEVKPTNDVERKKMDMTRATRDFLQTVEGAPFEQQFLSMQVAMHDMGVGMLTAAQKQLANSDLAPLVREQLPKLKEHRSRAHRLLGEQATMRQARTPPAGR